MKSVILKIEYDGQSHSIKLPAATKEEAVRELKSTAKSSFFADTVDWLFDELWDDAA